MAIATALACGFAAFAVSYRQEVSYAATSSVYATSSEVRLGSYNYEPVLLDADAYGLAATSDPVLQIALQLLGRTEMGPSDVSRLRSNVNVSKDSTSSASFIYITVNDESAAASSDIANAVAAALIQWDTDRSRVGISRTAEILERQLVSLQTEIAAAEASGAGISAEVSSANAQLGISISNQLSLLRAVEAENIGTLTMFEFATPPSQPSHPRLVLNTLLGFMFGLVAGYAVVLIYQVVRSEREQSVALAGSR